jgi:myo-inositol-hexaphosphate 3-phosphohydrolase
MSRVFAMTAALVIVLAAASSPGTRPAALKPLRATDSLPHDREGIGIYTLPGGTGYIVSVDQRPGKSAFYVYRREAEPGNPHDHSRVVASFTGGVDGTDGLDVTSAALGPDLAGGLLVAMNSRSRNFLLFRWHDIAAAARPRLTSAMSGGTR